MNNKKVTKIVIHIRPKKDIIENILEKATMCASIICLAGGFYLMSPAITGKVVADISASDSSGFGTLLLLAGLIAGFVWVSENKN